MQECKKLVLPHRRYSCTRDRRTNEQTNLERKTEGEGENMTDELTKSNHPGRQDDPAPARPDVRQSGRRWELGLGRARGRTERRKCQPARPAQGPPLQQADKRARDPSPKAPRSRNQTQGEDGAKAPPPGSGFALSNQTVPSSGWRLCWRHRAAHHPSGRDFRVCACVRARVRCCCDAAVGASLLVVEWRPSCTPDWERYATVGLPEAIVHLRSGPPNGRPSSQTNLHLYRPGQADTLTHTPDLSHTWSRSPLPTSWTAPSPTRQPAHGAAPTGPRRSMPDSGALLTPVTPLAAPDGTPRAAQLPPRTGWAGHPPHEACGASPTLAWANLGSYLTFSPAGTDRGRRAASGVL
ncbi:hypothetical protein Purlil1_8407 [Purpureocillium lilacinum]|uniref:Uncharacterized protein n=1 Tax=Purpureocillium lilacinum TaxID=33203 RepID=A0ABR0BTJ1_PURLI|nr:hypothetical protein Purlil1_8407 [Purpureocillium lilacinum]